MTGIEALREMARQESARVYKLSVSESTPEPWTPPTNAGQVVNQFPPYAAMCACGHSARLHPEDPCCISDCGCTGFEVST